MIGGGFLITGNHLELPVKYDAAVLWDKWRLVNNKELYNVSADPGQTTDMAIKHPDIVKMMTAHYEEWWESAGPLVYNKFTYIHIGADKQPETVLNSHDWMTMNTANHQYIRQGRNRSGAWNVFVEEEGKYTIELYRWPKEANLKLQEASPLYKAVDATFEEGVALPIHRANLRVGIQEYSMPVNKDDYCATFNVFLPKGPNTLQTFFYTNAGDQLCGAYYVYLRKSNK